MKKNTLEEIIQRFKDVHGDTYDYSKVIYTGVDNKVDIICKKHGLFSQTPYAHSKGQGCPECGKEKMIKSSTKTQETFLKQVKEIHGDKYDFSKAVYKGDKIKVCVVCHKKDEFDEEHGEFWSMPTNLLKGCGCPKCSKHFLDQESFIKRATKLHGGKYNYDKVRYINSGTNVIVTCPIHGDFEITPNNHLSGQACNKCSKRPRMNTEEVINRLKEIHGDKYDYSKVVFKNMMTDIILTCPIHGDFPIKPASAIYRKGGCRFCGYEEMKLKQRVPIERLLEEFKAAHGDKYNYSEVESTYVNARTNVKIYCKKHKEYFYQSPDAHKRGVGCPKCAESNLEKEIEDLLKVNNFDYNSQKIIKSSIIQKLDFYLQSLKIGIECQGEQHFKPVDFAGKGKEWAEDVYKSNLERDLIKKNFCVDNNIELIYYTTKEFYDTYCRDQYLGKVFYDKEELLKYILNKAKNNNCSKKLE